MRAALRVMSLWVTTAFRASPGLTVMMTVLMVSGSVLAPLGVLGITQVIDAASTGASMVPGLLLTASTLVVGATVGRLANPLGQTLDEKVSRYVHDDLLRLTTDVWSIDLHEHPELADRLALVERDARSLGGIFRLLAAVSLIASAATVIAMLWSVSPIVVLLLPLAFVPAALLAHGYRRREQLWRGNERYRRLGSMVLDVLLDARQGVEVRCFGLSPVLLQISRWAMDVRRVPWVRLTLAFCLRAGFGWLIFGIGYAAAIVWVLDRVRHGQASIGDLTLVLLIGPQVSTTAQGLAANLTTIISSMETFGRYQWLRDYSAERRWRDPAVTRGAATRGAGALAAPATPANSVPATLHSGIQFVDVGFTYPSGSTPSIANVALELPAGTVVAFVGANGAGKSTLVKLLARLYDPTEGQILIDGAPLAEMDPAVWRRRISAGFQDFARLEFLARESVTVGDLERPEDADRLAYAISAGQADPVVADLPAGLDTQLGRQFASGADLSGGQWQRLALARAFLRESPLLMLLDEPTAALDPEAEAAIYDEYARIARDLGRRTGAVTVLVSHRFSTVRMADLIVVVDDGQITEIGSHSDLLNRQGRYAELFELQASAYR